MSDHQEIASLAREREELTRRIFEAMPGGILHVRADGAILRANPEAQRVLGLKLDELTARYVTDFETATLREDGSDCPAEEYPVARALTTGQDQPPVTIGVRRPDGTVSWAVFTAVPLCDPETRAITGAVVTFIDISDSKRAELERRALQRRLIAADRMASIGTLAAGVAHEINNPLTYVLTNLQLLEGELAQALEGDSRGFRLRARVRDAGEGLDRIRNVVRDLNTFSHVDERITAIDIHAVLESSLRMAANELRYRAQITRSYGRVSLVSGNASRLGQVFLNLLVNASHAIPAGKVEDNEIIVRTRQEQDDHVLIEISDTGGGIDPELLGGIFEPFVTSKEKGEGTGLGLYVCHSIVTELGGKLEVESTSDGTTFRVRLPSRELSQDFDDGSGADLEIPNDDAPPIQVLVVDDEAGILSVFEQTLVRHTVTLATSGRQALQEMADRQFDLIFCDLIMPDGTGMDVYDDVKRRWPETAERIVFMTGGAFTDRARRFVKDQRKEILHKPFTEEDLLRIVTERAEQSVADPNASSS